MMTRGLFLPSRARAAARREAGSLLLVVGVLATCSTDSPPLPTGPDDQLPPPGDPATPPLGPPPPLYVPPPPEALPSEPPTSDRLTSVVTHAFGDAPVEGLLYLIPGQDGLGVPYEVDLDEDGSIDHAGMLEQTIGFAYRFSTPGAHRVRVIFSGSTTARTVEHDVIVNDPSGVSLIAQARVPPDPGEDRSFEGIAVDRRDARLYVANYRGGSLVQLDTADLRELARIDSIPYSIEGLSITPSDSLLFAVYKYHNASVTAIPSLELRRIHSPSSASFFIHAIDDRRALVSGRFPFTLYDMESGASLSEAKDLTGETLWAWHFAVSPDGTMAAVASRQPGRTHVIHLVDIGSMRTVREIEVTGIDYLLYVTSVAFDPHQERLYIMGNELLEQDGTSYLDRGHFVVVDLGSGDLLRDLPLGNSYCSGYCVANPVATSASGKYVAMEWYGGAYIIDTGVDLPLYRVGLYGYSLTGFSVAASPIEDIFYFLNPSGDVYKVRMR